MPDFITLLKTFFMIDQTMVTTNIELSGYRIKQNLGVVRGITVRSRSLLGNMAGVFQTLFGGKISIYAEFAKKQERKLFSKCWNMLLKEVPMQSLVCVMMPMM